VAFLVDLHVHSAASGDNDADPDQLVAAAIGRGLDGLAFTEHDSWAASAFVDRLRERHRGRILLLRGVEISAAEGHCLVFGVDTDRLRLGGARVRDLVRAVAAAGGAVVPSHPFRPGSGIGELVREPGAFTALEGCNGANLRAMNERALGAARALGLPTTGGSDAHAPREVGSCRTVFEERVTPESFLAALRAGRYRGEDTRRASSSLWP
jgi:predicted metal-dependent phosphoesterase TrpH